MTKPSKARTKAAATTAPVPQGDADAAAAIARIGTLMRRIASIQAYADERIAEIHTEVAQELQAPKAELDGIRHGLQIYCEAHRERLTQGGKSKTVPFPTGVALWRQRPPKVTLRGAVDEIVCRIQDLGLAQFLRTKVEPDRNAMLADPDRARAIAGVSIGSAGEDFVVEPTETGGVT